MSENATTDVSTSRARRAGDAARSGLDVMLGEAATGGPPRFLAPGSGVKVGAGLARHPRRVAARAAGPTAELSAGRHRALRARAGQGRPAIRGPGLGGQLAAAPGAPGLPRGRRDRRRADLRRRRRLARRAAGAAGRRQRARRARADELRLVKPDGAQGDGQHRRRQPGARRRRLRPTTSPRRRGFRRPSTRASSRSAATWRPRRGRSCCAPRCSS